MREPTLRQPELAEAIQLAEWIYRLHEGGRPYQEEQARLIALTGQEITTADVRGAFGSIAPEDWAHTLMLASEPLPDGLSRGELIQMIRTVSEITGPEWLQHWYLRCLEHSTGCDAITDILDSPEALDPEQVLNRALGSKRGLLITPPPKEGS